MKYLEFIKTGQKISCTAHENILESALKAGIDISHSCGGMGTCGTCRIIIREGLDLLPRRNELEQEMASDRNFSPEERLACQTTSAVPLKIEVPAK